MKAALVKIDVAAADLGKSVAQVFELVDGGTTHEAGIVWVFNLANDLNARRRDLRFWRPELFARVQGQADKFNAHELDNIIPLVLTENRLSFQAGEVDQLFQIRPHTRRDYGNELPGNLDKGAHVYSRTALSNFLKRRWLSPNGQTGKALAA
ncbi:MAG: hypothetical protein WDN00_00435 [Limisphaerales bacterium]